MSEHGPLSSKAERMKHIAALCVGLACLCIPMLAHGADKEQMPGLYGRVSVSAQMVPQFLLRLEADQSPTALWGLSETLCAGYSFNQHWSLGVCGFHLGVSGRGPFSRSKDLAAFGVAGVAHGKLRLDLIGGGVEGERRFFLTDNLAISIRLLLGVGKVSHTFKGTFKGYLLPNPTQRIEAPAKDNDTRLVPIVGLGTGVAWQLNDRILLTARSGWNTGFFSELGLVYRFDLLG